MWLKHFLVFIVCSAPALAADDAPMWPHCKNTETLIFKRPEAKPYKAADVEEMTVTMRKEAGCDDGVFGEGATDIVCRALVSDFKAVIEYGSSNNPARNFILRHIDATASHEDLQKIISMEKSCEKQAGDFCLDVISEAKKVVKDMMKDAQTPPVIAELKRETCTEDRLLRTLRENPKRTKELFGQENDLPKIEGCDWNDLTNAIERGNYELFDLASPFTDAGFSEDLNISMAMSIFFVPSKALAKGHCVPDVIEPSEPDWIELLATALKRVKTVTDPKLLGIKAKCLNDLTKDLRKAKSRYQKLCVIKSETDSWSGGCFKSDRFEAEVSHNL